MTLEDEVLKHKLAMRNAASSVPRWVRYASAAMTLAGVLGGVALIHYQEGRRAQSRPAVEVEIGGKPYHCTPAGSGYSCSPR